MKNDRLGFEFGFGQRVEILRRMEIEKWAVVESGIYGSRVPCCSKKFCGRGTWTSTSDEKGK